MKFFFINLIFILAFHLTYCQSKIIGNSYSNKPSVSPGSQSEPGFQPGNTYGIIRAESTHGRVNSNFQPGVIITKDGDTLRGLVKYIYPVPLDKISYKADLSRSDSIFSVEDIKSIVTQSVYLANIPFEGKEKMMRWLSVGKINLYSYLKYYESGNTDLTYVLEKNNQFIYINKKDFKVMMRHVFFDSPDILKNIGKKGYRFNDMIKVVREYNKRFQ